MNGREEREQKLNEKAVQKLIGLPRFVADWYVHLQVEDLTAKSRFTYVDIVSQFCKRQHITNINDVTNISTERFLLSTHKKEDGSPSSKASQQLAWSAMNKFEDYLEQAELINKNYVKNIRRPKNNDNEAKEKKKVLLTSDDFKKMLTVEKDNERNYAILLLFMTTGIRLSALDNINIEDINFEDQVITVIDKGNKTHNLKINDITMKAINDWLDVRPECDTSALFVSRNGVRIDNSQIANMVSDCANKALGIRFHPHKLRGGFITILYNKTHDIDFVRRAVGHSKITTTQGYIVSDGKEREKAADIFENMLM